LSAFFTWARKHGHYPGAHPVRDVPRFAERRREYTMTLADFARVADALRRAEADGLPPRDRRATGRTTRAQRTAADPYAVAALRVLVQTGMRLGEVLALRWSDVDARDRTAPVLRLPDSKTGAKDVPIRADVLAVLEALPRDANNPHVFPARRQSAKRSTPAPLDARTVRDVWERVRVAAELPLDRHGRPPRVHDLRHAFVGLGLARGHGLDQLGQAVGHRSAATTRRYAALAATHERRLLEDVSGAIASAMAPADAPRAAVVPIARKRRRAN
jgi:integrase